MQIPNLRIRTTKIKPYLQSVRRIIHMQNKDSEHQMNLQHLQCSSNNKRRRIRISSWISWDKEDKKGYLWKNCKLQTFPLSPLHERQPNHLRFNRVKKIKKQNREV